MRTVSVFLLLGILCLSQTALSGGGCWAAARVGQIQEALVNGEEDSARVLSASVAEQLAQYLEDGTVFNEVGEERATKAKRVVRRIIQAADRLARANSEKLNYLFGDLDKTARQYQEIFSEPN